MEAHLLLGDPFDLRGDIFKDKGHDAYSEMEDHMLLLRESGENNSDHSPSTLLSLPFSDSRKKHKETMTKGVSLYRGSQSNSDADLDECLVDFTKRVRLKKGNSVRKKKSKYSLPKNQSPSTSK
ncbi:hypothetical protein Ancab_013283 [Ancistrocladus abbreviatus]